MDGARRSLAVVRVEEHAIGQVLHSFGDSVELAIELFGHAGGEAELGDLAGRVAINQLSGAPSATIFALSMTTRRSHSCSASSM